MTGRRLTPKSHRRDRIQHSTLRERPQAVKAGRCFPGRIPRRTLAAPQPHRNRLALGHSAAANVLDGLVIHAGAEVNRVFQHLNVDVVVVKNHGGLDRLVSRTLDVIAVATGNVSVESGLATLVAWRKNLENVEFATARFPAGALGLSVLQSARDLSIEHPDCRHVNRIVLAGGRLATDGHLEFEEESL
ncbi:hypothetical protein KC323_g77 [Hortaea werneckii]|nr:hypothetical protein KC323_g77 [Hortaea werneckii]